MTEVMTEGKEPSRYMQRKFTREFRDGADFWTGENGMMTTLVVERRPDWLEVLKRNYSHYIREEMEESGGREAFVERVYKEPDDDFQGCRKLWRISDGPTPFPVIAYDLKVPW